MRALLIRVIAALRKFWMWLVAAIAFLLLWLLKLLPADAAMNFAAGFVRWAGPKTSRHKLMLYNLRRAFPEKSEVEREAIALESWENMGRLAAEYVFLDELFDFDPAKPGDGRIEVSGIPLFLQLRDTPRPFIVFTAHTGSFELLPVASAAYGLYPTVLFRPPNNPYIAERVHDFRAARMGNLVPSHTGSAFALARTLEQGGCIGVLVDQKFAKGLESQFFGLPVRTNPLLAKLVRQFNCEVYPARSIRLPGGRYRLEIEPAMTVPRTEAGDVDIDATAQALNNKVESWVREYPGQWLWYHDRWAVKNNVL
jgi:KDO2-lipid IV(A) lauroyltransferase